MDALDDHIRGIYINFQFRKTEILSFRVYLCEAFAIGSQQTAQDCIAVQMMDKEAMEHAVVVARTKWKTRSH